MPRIRYTIIRVPASSVEEAHEIIGRMTGLGFPRNTMNVTPHEDDTYHVAIHTRESNRARVMSALESDDVRSDWGLSKTTLMLITGGAAALGAGLWALRAANIWPKLSEHEPEGEHDQPFRLLGDHAAEPSQTGGVGGAAHAGEAAGTSPNTGFSSADPPRAPSGLGSSLQPGGTVPGGGPGASAGSLGTGGGQTENRDAGSLKRDGA